jgi:hypothetical protein
VSRSPLKKVPAAVAALALGLAVLAGAASCSLSGTVTPRAVPGSPAAPGKAAGNGGGTVSALSQPSTDTPVWVTLSTVTSADGSTITVATFHGPVQFVLHNGSFEPGNKAGPVLAGPKVTLSERSRLLAAFNGGFEIKSHAGGYEQEGHVAWPLRAGLASLVIDQAGQARIGVWGQDVPVPGQPVYSVRQNLWLLVSNGQPTPESALWWRWGATIRGQENVARSALGETATGQFIYAASMSTNPADLAQALVQSGAQVAMELDINPQWVQLDTAAMPGGPLLAKVPGQHRPATQYLTGWTRDFIAVLAP